MEVNHRAHGIVYNGDMKKRSCCLAVVLAAAIGFVLICVLVFIGNPRFYRVYSSVRLGESEKSVRARYAPLTPEYIGISEGNDGYGPPSTVKYLLVIDRESQHFLFYLDGSGRVVDKRHYFD